MKKNQNPIVSFICLIFFAGIIPANAEPPLPPEGMRWVLNEDYSDEFNGSELDTEKWFDYYPGWEGRPPARFEPRALSFGDGKLMMTNGILEEPKGPFQYYGGAIVSKKTGAHFGYYECRVKASKVNMSTTFWLSNGKTPFHETEDLENDSYSQELDIQEAIGGSPSHQKFRHNMNCNTHYRYIPEGETKEIFYSKGCSRKLKSEVSEDYHTYGAWWVDEEKVKFFANDEYFETVRFTKEISKHPFNRPMHVNMVTETYSWHADPVEGRLLDPELNTSYYDWVRCYKLLPYDEELKVNFVKLYEHEDLTLEDPEVNLFDTKKFDLTFTYKTNVDRVLLIEVSKFRGGKEVVQSMKIPALTGYAHFTLPFEIDFEPEEGVHYRLKATLHEKDLGKQVVIDWVSIDLSK